MSINSTQTFLLETSRIRSERAALKLILFQLFQITAMAVVDGQQDLLGVTIAFSGFQSCLQLSRGLTNLTEDAAGRKTEPKVFCRRDLRYQD